MNNALTTFCLNSTKRILTALMPALLACLLFACSDNENLTSLSQKSIIYCAEASPESFNPQTTSDSTTVDATSNQLYDRLLTINPKDNTLIPSLAKSWHVTRDGKMITIYLRKNVEFHATDYFYPSRSLNADDVLFSFARILDPDHEFHLASNGKYPYFERVDFPSNIVSIEKINDYTVRFTLNEPDASFLANLATQYAVILSSEYADILAEKQLHRQMDTMPIGTGPFKLKEYRVGSFIRYYRHDQYWRKQPAIKQLVYDITASNTGRLTKLLTGECDIIAKPVGHNKILEHPNLMLESVTSLDAAFLAFNTLEAPFNDPKVRKAISYAIDKQAIISAVYLGHGVQAHSVLPPVSWAYHAGTANQPFDVTYAKRLLSEAGYPDGFTMSLWASPIKHSYNPNSLSMAILIKENLDKIGITVEITREQPAKILGLSKKPSYQAYLDGWSADHPDPDNFFSSLLSCSASETGTNSAFWCHQDFDNLLEKSRQTDKIEQRKYYYQQALNLLNNEMPIIPIAHSKSYIARNDKIEGQFFNSLGVQFFHVSKQ